MGETRYAYDREQGFIVDMGRPRHDNPHLEWALTNSEVVRLLNDLEAKLSKMEEQDEVHWKTRRKLVADNTVLRKELDVTDKLLEERNKLLSEFPACEFHGDQCIPHASDWFKESIALRKRVEGLEATVDAALFESLAEDATAASVMLVIRETLAEGEEA